MLIRNYDEFKKLKITLASAERIRLWSHGEVTKPETINYRTFRPERNGLFCERIFGPVKDWECSCGKYRRVRYRGIVCERCGVEVTHSKVRRERMGHIELASPVTHIWYLKGVPSFMGVLLDMTVKALEEVVYYDSYIITEVAPELEAILEIKQRISEQQYYELREKYGDKFKADIGAKAIKTLLKKLDLKKLIVELKEDIKDSTNQKRLKLTKRYRVVDSFLTSGNKPEWMIMDAIPIMPPDLRPMVQLEGGRFATSDLNDLYRRVINRNNRLKRLLDIGAPNMIVKNEMRMLQEAVDVLLNNGRRGRIVTGGNGRPLKSLSDIIQGKNGRFRQNLLGKRVDYSGRSVIVVGPKLKIHQCGLPKMMALELFKPFVIRKLVEKGFVQNVKSAKRKIDRKDIEIWDVLEEIIDGYPVLLNRAPTLHRLGIQAFEPVLVEGKALQLHPLVCTAFNADFDGDQMAIHIPLTVEAKTEARLLMLANNNVLAPANGRSVITPSQDMVLGIYYLTIADKEMMKVKPRIYSDFDAVIKAFGMGAVTLHTRIQVKHKNEVLDTTVGRVVFNASISESLLSDNLPEQDFINEVNGKKQLANLISEWHDNYGNRATARLADKLKDLGFAYATKAGVSIALSDLIVFPEKKEIIAKAFVEVDRMESLKERGIISNQERRLRELEVWRTTVEKVTNAMKNSFDELNSVYMMASSGARGSIDQVKQLAGMRGLMSDATGDTVDIPILTNFREGLTSTEYFISTYGARKGLVDIALRTADSGYLTRRLVDIGQDILITEEDCRTTNSVRITAIKEGYGEVISLEERLIGRVCLDKIVDPETGKVVIDIDETISPKISKVIGKLGIKEVQVRSVITCEAKRGLCQKCYGEDLSSRQLINLGEAVGIIAAQSIGEPGTQLTMRTFHTGGVDLSRAAKLEVAAELDGKVSFLDKLATQDILDEYGDKITVVTGAGTIKVAGSNGQEQVISASEGFELLVKNKTTIKKGEIIFSHDPTLNYLKVTASGEVIYSKSLETIENIVEGKTLNYVAKTNGEIYVLDISKSKVYGISESDKVKVVVGQYLDAGATISTKNKADFPGVVYKVSAGSVEVVPAKTYVIETGSIIFRKNGEKIANGELLRKEKRINFGTKAKDIVAGLPKVEALFESRTSKNKAIISSIAGLVEINTKDAQKVVSVINENEQVDYKIPLDSRIIVQAGDKIIKGSLITEGVVSPHDILEVLGVQSVQEYLLEEVQKVYRGQGVTINDKHIEVILRQMTKKVKIVSMGDSTMLPGELVDINQFRAENTELIEKGKEIALGERVLLGITKASLNTESFISAASFQETAKVLTEAAIKGKVDEMYGLKENVIIGKLIPAGTGFYASIPVSLQSTLEPKKDEVLELEI
ncbi:MAG: DNA-directed RNA polymerase subunit beta' [Candidatus Margulisbacteria bacterium]|nr:DNA-directed RNA polymerase subunit beta' [Candidatus Margulisiibacteriota bacterium]